MLVEVLVSAVLLVIVSVGVLGAIDSATRATSEERHHARAAGIAQSDQARMRSMQISDLSNLNETRTVSQDGTPYSVVSRGDYVTDATGTSSCAAGTASADYVKTTSTVSWPSMGNRPPVVSNSIVAPPNGSISDTSGALAVGVENSRNEGIAGVGLSGSGAGTFSGVTGENGCAIFGNLPAGNYTLNAAVSALVDKDGNSSAPQATSVVAGSTNTVVLQYDDPGSIPVNFKTRAYGTNGLVDSSADQIVTFNTGMTAARLFPGTSGARLASINATSMFPFTSPYSVYAGTCQGDNPDPTGGPSPPPAIQYVDVPQGAAAPTTTIELPALHVTVYRGSTTSSAPAPNATVKVRDLNCSDFLRTFTTNAQGRLDDPGLPYSDYSVCASGLADDDTIMRRATGTAGSPAHPSVTSMATGTVLNLFLAGTGSASGTCP